MRAIFAGYFAVCVIVQSIDVLDVGGDGTVSSSEFERDKQDFDHSAWLRCKQEASELREAREELRQRQDRIEQLEWQLRDNGIVPVLRPPPPVPPQAAADGAPAGLPPVAEEPDMVGLCEHSIWGKA